MTRYLTLTATVAVPEGTGPNVARALARAALTLALLGQGFELVDPHWAPDPDTIADAMDVPFADHEVVEVLP